MPPYKTRGRGGGTEKQDQDSQHGTSYPLPSSGAGHPPGIRQEPARKRTQSPQVRENDVHVRENDVQVREKDVQVLYEQEKRRNEYNSGRISLGMQNDNRFI